MKTKNKVVLLDGSQKSEVLKLCDILIKHKKKYEAFKSFVKTCDDALMVANALLNNDLKTFKNYSLKYSQHSAEKMKGIDSLSTYKKTSDICNYLSMHDGICKKCYAEKSLSLYKSSLTPALIYNTLLLKYIDLDPAQIPYINNKYFRFESFSDLQSAKHLKNLIQICKKNKNTIFTLWTKAGYHLIKMLENENIKKLPNNLNFVISEFYINKKTDLEYLKNLQKCLYPAQALKNKYTNALKAFSVFDNEKTRQDANMFICKNKCIDCLKCYKKVNQLFILQKNFTNRKEE